MRKNRSMPTLNNRASHIAPLVPASRPSGVFWNGGFSEYAQPQVKWEHSGTRLAHLQEYQERSGWAKDSFDVHRPLHQRLVRAKPEKVWRNNEVGSKLAFNDRTSNRENAASAAWDMWRPVNHTPPPWCNAYYPRAQYNATSSMGAMLTS
eukprot:TRINITY_DN5194_c0_g1_i1.p1 TRINITY_DN5194_c0_g1~~TRINITY_DN5194_c0_g1_i1.p1  ORF type:complete len:150 (-),score=22.38 TRINITY_DN5194_c0_g1_i1:68-517(-)